VLKASASPASSLAWSRPEDGTALPADLDTLPGRESAAAAVRDTIGRGGDYWRASRREAHTEAKRWRSVVQDGRPQLRRRCGRHGSTCELACQGTATWPVRRWLATLSYRRMPRSRVQKRSLRRAKGRAYGSQWNLLDSKTRSLYSARSCDGRRDCVQNTFRLAERGDSMRHMGIRRPTELVVIPLATSMLDHIRAVVADRGEAHNRTDAGTCPASRGAPGLGETRTGCVPTRTPESSQFGRTLARTGCTSPS
jgi:hypothetical protein